MKKKLLAILMYTFLISASSALTQTPSVVGGIGLIRMPTADVLPPQHVSIGIDYNVENTAIGTSSAALPQKGIYSYKIDLGTFLGREKGLELGIIGRTDKETNKLKEGVFVNIKYSLSSEDVFETLHLAIGLENLASQNDMDAYMVASKYFPDGPGIHFGTMFDFPNSKFRPLGMFGLTFPIGGKDLSALGEAFAGENILQVNAGIRLNLQKSFSILIRGVNLSNSPSSKDPQSYYAGISFKNPF